MKRRIILWPGLAWMGLAILLVAVAGCSSKPGEGSGTAQAATAPMEHPIPVVFLHPSDPVRDGLVESLSHPGGNLTGVFGARDPVVNQLELYKQIVPKLHRLLTLVDSTFGMA